MPLDKAHSILATELALVGVTGLLVFLRLYVRWVQQRQRINASDCVVVIGWLGFLLGAICDINSIAEGLWQPGISYNTDIASALPIEDKKNLVSVLKIMYLSALPYYTCLWAIKAAILLLYYPIIPTTLPKLRIVLHFTAGFTAIGYIVSISLDAFACLPVQRNWSMNAADACFSYSSAPVWFTITAFHVISDALICIIPFPFLRTLKLPRRQLIEVIIIFSLAGLCIICTIIRTLVIGLEANVATVALWTTFEQATGLVVVCCPALKNLIRSKRWKSNRGAELEAAWKEGLKNCHASWIRTNDEELK